MPERRAALILGVYSFGAVVMLKATQSLAVVPALGAAGTVIHVSEGGEIAAQGEPADEFFRVLSGVVLVCKFLKDGRRLIESFHLPGECFGLESGSEYPFSAKAVSDCTLVSYRRRTIETLAQKDDGLSRQLLALASDSLAEARRHALLLARRGAAEKMAGFLLALWARLGRRRSFTLAMTRQDIGDYLGLTIETVSRTLSLLERQGVIALANFREVQLKNVDALEDLAA
jgi:CRP/FNR family nitrogen fixation transcriptional regulator